MKGLFLTKNSSGDEPTVSRFHFLGYEAYVSEEILDIVLHSKYSREFIRMFDFLVISGTISDMTAQQSYQSARRILLKLFDWGMKN